MSDRLGDMELFVRIVRHGAMGAAGESLGLSPGSVSSRLKAMEVHYGVRLLNRTTRTVRPTIEGLEFYEACRRILGEVEEAEARLGTNKDALAGPLRVTAPSDLGQQHVAQVLSDFCDQYPEVVPFLHLTDGITDLVQEGFDVAVRYGLLPDSTLVARKLLESRRVLVASPEYLDCRRRPELPQDLKEHALLVMLRGSQALMTWSFRRSEESHKVRVRAARAVNDGAMVRRWAIEGAGIALKSFWDVSEDLRAGRLEVVMPDYQIDFGDHEADGVADLNLVYPSRKLMPHRVRAFADALQAHFARISAAVEPRPSKMTDAPLGG